MGGNSAQTRFETECSDYSGPARNWRQEPTRGPDQGEEDGFRARTEKSSRLSGSGDKLPESPAARLPNKKEARDFGEVIGLRTNPSVPMHVAAARRAAQTALVQNALKTRMSAVDRIGLGALPAAGRTKRFQVRYGHSVLITISLSLVATAAVRMAAMHLPASTPEPATNGWLIDSGQSELPQQRAGPAIPMTSGPNPIDTMPTASIAPALASPESTASEKATPDLISALPLTLPRSLRDAATSGWPNAEYQLALRFLQGRGVAQDPRAAATWFERAASSGLAPAQFQIALMYEKGIGVGRDVAVAKRWYLKAARSGNAKAAHNLAALYAEASDEEPDFNEAANWFRKAGALGVRDSQFNLGVLYARGLGLQRDLRQSWLWFSLAAAQGDADAVKKRDEIAAKMDAASLAAAADALVKFKPLKPDPVANEVTPP